MPSEPTIDLSDAIAQIGAEIERIGWTKKQGSSYLQEAYSKRTRAELTETELLSFLQYLKALPAKIAPALSDLPF
jgi:virulence-associated protein VapD